MRPSIRRAGALTGSTDPVLILAFVALTAVGVLMVYSASVADAYSYYRSQFFYVEREIIWVCIGLAVLTVTARTDYHRWSRWALFLFGGALLLLVAVMVPGLGHQSHGAQRWFSVGSFIEIEPSELIKLGLVLYLAAWLTGKGPRVREMEACFAPFSVVVCSVCFLILREPDLGTAAVVAALALATFFVAGASLTQMGWVLGGGSTFLWVFTHIGSYRHARLTAFMNPWSDPTGVGYHTIQALIALRNGGLFGRGLGDSLQKWYLPAPHTDSILAVIGEEWGLVGTLAVLALFLVVGHRGIRAASTAPDQFGRLLAAGITTWIVFQALLNFAVITASVPFTGVPLPFISYGGTSLVITMAAMGILMNISQHSRGTHRAGHNTDNGGRDGGTRLPGPIRHPAIADSGSARSRFKPQAAIPTTTRRP